MSTMVYKSDHDASPSEEEKAEVYGIEHVDQAHTHADHLSKALVATEFEDAQLKSGLDNLPLFEAIRLYKKTILICALAGFCASTDGFQNQMASSIVSNQGFIRQFGYYNATTKAWALVPLDVSLFGGIFSTGQVVGQFTVGFVADRFGRKVAMYYFLVLLTIAAVVEIVSRKYWHWIIAKLFAGIGIGSVQAVLPVYINEHAPAQMRGFLIVAYSMWFSLGGLIASIALSVRSTSDPLDWKTPIYIEFGMIGLSALVFLGLPESPWWLMRKGKVARAEKVFRSKFGGVKEYDFPVELAIMQATIDRQNEWDAETKSQGTLSMLKGLNRKRFLIASYPKVLQQFVGLSIFSNYSTYFFQLAGNTHPFNATIILGCVSLASVLLDALLVDKIGRRRMTLIGFTGASSGVTLMAIVGCLNYTNKSLGAVLVFSGAVANFFNTFQSSTSYAYLTEIPEVRFRAQSTGWGLAYCNLYAIIFAYTVPLMIAKWKVKTAFLFMGLGIPGTILSFFIMPETMRRSPAEVQELFIERVPLTKWRGHVTKVEKDLEIREAKNACD